MVVYSYSYINTYITLEFKWNLKNFTDTLMAYIYLYIPIYCYCNVNQHNEKYQSKYNILTEI